MNRLFTVAILVMALGPAQVQAQNSFSTLEEQMTGKEFVSAGLDKLSAEELAALNEWLRTHSVATLETATEPLSDQRGFENQTIAEMGKEDVVSTIVGPFSGWDGETIFKLENGMIWKQSEADRFAIPEVQNPPVIIERGLLKSWKLSVEGYNKSVRVRRIQ